MAKGPGFGRFLPAALLSAIMVMVLTGRLHDAVLYGKLPVAKVFFVTGFVLLLLGRPWAVLQAGWRTLPARGFVGLTLAILASVPFSVLPSGSIGAALLWLTTTVPFVVLVTVGIRCVDDLELVLRSLVLMVIATGLLMIAGFGIVESDFTGTRMTLAGSYDPNDLAAVIAASSAACLWVFRGSSLVWKLLGVTGLALAGFVIVKTGSRGGAISFGAMLLGTAFLLRRSLSTTVRFGIVSTLVVGLVFAPSEFAERLSTLKDIGSDYNMTATSGRAEVWKRGIGYVVRSPIVGVGVGVYPIADGRWASENGVVGGFKWSAAHNLLLETSAELGIPGLVALLCSLLPILLTWKRTRQQRTKSFEETRLHRAVEAIAIMTMTFMVGTVFVSGLFNPLLQVLIALSIGAHSLHGLQRWERPGKMDRSQLAWPSPI